MGDLIYPKNVKRIAEPICQWMHNAPYGFVLGDAEGRVIWVNPAFTTMCGHELTEIVGQKPGAFLQGPETDPAAIHRLRQAVKRRESCHVRILNYHKSGRAYWSQIDLHCIPETHEHPVFFAAIETDVTDVVQQEAQLQREVVELYGCVLAMAEEKEGPARD